jgi:DNA primase (bacterial type)
VSRRIPEEVIDDVRSQVNILDIVEQYVQMHRSGKNWFGLCPFHTEKTASFSVNEQKQIFNCFSCHRGGNVFKFIMEIENLSFPEAVIRVADLGNVTIDQEYIDDVKTGNIMVLVMKLIPILAFLKTIIAKQQNYIIIF